MEEIQFWKLTKGDDDLAREIQKGYDALVAHPPRGYLQPSNPVWEFVPIEENKHLFVARNSENLLGWADCRVSGPGEIGDIVKMMYIDDSDLEDRKPYCRDAEGNYVTRANIGNYAGYRDYTGQGTALNIGFIEAFVRGKGIGSALLDFILAQEYELVDLEPDSGGKNFFIKRGFIETGIFPKGSEQVLVWNNPNYLKN